MRSLLFRFVCVALVGAVPLLLAGCNNNKETSHDDPHDHDHDGQSEDSHEDHDHDHAEGPHGGHLLELTGADKDFHAEWLHDDEKGIVTVCLLEDDAKTPLDQPPEMVKIEVRSGNAPTTYELPATDTVNEVPAKAAYSITDPALVTALEIIVDGQEPLLHVEIGEKPVTAKFEKHEHDHDHDH